MTNNNSSRQRLLIIASLVIMALLAVNAFLLLNKYNQDKIITEQTADLDEASKLKIELEKQYQEALSELEEMRGSNEDLNAIIDQQKAELAQQKGKIEAMIAGGIELNQARAEIKKMKARQEGYVAEIETLKSDKQALIAEREKLSERAEALAQNLDSTNIAFQQLNTEKEAVAAEKQQVTAEKNILTETVSLASVIKVSQVNVTPLKERNSGKTVKKKLAKNVDQLKICFKTIANEVVKPGMERFFMRIINPQGETMAIDELGAGTMVSKKTGEEVRYTGIKDYDYNNDEADICFNWDPNLGAFGKGKYTVEVYNKGHLSGKGTFDLK